MPRSATEIPIVTHLLSPAPSEFHVYLSLATGHAMYVGTRAGVWSVERGRIRYAGALG